MQRNNSSPQFSVIVPVYNVCDYINACLNSVLSQTFRDFELILIDDGSNDGSEQICDNYASEYDNIIIVHKENGGQSSARNLGVELARGEYFVFVDSDDYIAANTLEMFEDKIKKHGELDVILSERMFNVEPDGNVIDIQRHLESGDFEGVDGKKALLMMGMEWSPCGKCFRTEFWKENGFRFIEGIISEDFQLIDRVTIEAQKIAMVPAHYYYRWKIESSTMHVNYEKLVRDTIFVLEDWNRYLSDKSFDEDLSCIIKKTLAIMLEHTVMGNIFYVDRSKTDELVEGVKRCRELLRYNISIEGCLVRLGVGTIGVRNTCFWLNKIKTIRKKREHFV